MGIPIHTIRRMIYSGFNGGCVFLNKQYWYCFKAQAKFTSCDGDVMYIYKYIYIYICEKPLCQPMIIYCTAACMHTRHRRVKLGNLQSFRPDLLFPYSVEIKSCGFLFLSRFHYPILKSSLLEEWHLKWTKFYKWMQLKTVVVELSVRTRHHPFTPTLYTPSLGIGSKVIYSSITQRM